LEPMKANFRQLLEALRPLANKFDTESGKKKLELLLLLSQKEFSPGPSLTVYCNLLMFLAAHPQDEQLLEVAEAELDRLADFLRRQPKNVREKFLNSGLPFTRTNTTFSHDLLSWMMQQQDYDVIPDSFNGELVELSDALQFTLPPLEKEVTTVGYTNREILPALKVKKENLVPFLLSQFGRLNEQPFIKDYFFDAIRFYVYLEPKTKQFSKAFNRFSTKETYFHNDLLKHFDHDALLNKKLPKPVPLSPAQLDQLDAVMKNTLALLQRETDPVSYIDKRSLRYYELERGISIAIFGMIPERQLPVESYVGYTLFKNGFPAAYGGGWVFGKRSLFGINVFEAFRGGESGYVLCQLLRTYRQAFGIDYFEVEPYQYGKGNPEGIKSGAFWFYYRFGFRPLDDTLNRLAQDEAEHIGSKKGYRTCEATLKQFAECNIALNLGKEVPVTLAALREKITALIAERYYGNRPLAEKELVQQLLKKAGVKPKTDSAQRKTLIDFAFLAEAMELRSPRQLRGIVNCALLKPHDLYSCQQELRRILR
jgi:hypothetical protein